MENKYNTFITLGNLRRFLENLNVDISDQKTYLDAQDANILQTAKSYTDSQVSGAINTASNDATNKSNVVQNNLNTHITNITDAHDMANRLQALKVAMQTYTDQGISKVVGGAPELLNTLYEFSNAIGNDPNYSSTMMTMIGQKLNSSEIVNTPAINKILRLDTNAQFPASVIAQDMNNRFFTDAERSKLAGIAVNANNYVHPVNHLPSIITQDANSRFFTDVERAKLVGIDAGANLYVHPVNHPPSIITQDANNRFVTDVEKAKWNSTEPNSKSYTDSKITELNNKKPVGSKGQVYYIKNDNSSEIQLSQILSSGRFVETAAELAEEKAKKISFATIFNTWERFRSLGLNGEENSWRYDSSNDRVICTTNSTGYIGFVSPDKYDKYTHEAIFSSTDIDDDVISLVIAYHKDSEGKLYTLSACRTGSTGNGANMAGGHNWSIVYNLLGDDTTPRPGTKVICGDGKALKATSGGGWNNFGSVGIRVTRDGDNIVCETTTFENTTNYIDQYKFTINLTSDPLLNVFRGPKQYGYGSLSQASSTFSNIAFSDISSMIFDISTNKILVFKNGTWAVDSTKSIVGEIGVGRLISNPSTGKLFFIKDKDTIIPITTKIPLANNTTTTATGTALDAAQGKLLNDKMTTHKGAKGVLEHGLGDGTSAGFSINDYTTAEKSKLAGIATGATNYTHPATHPVSILTGVLPISNGGTGVSSKDGIVQLLYNSGDKNSIAIGSLYMMAFETNGANCGYLSLPALKTKLQWTTAELQNALANLPNI